MALDPLSLRHVVLGGGSIGKRHLGNLQAVGVKQLVVAEPSAERRAAIEQQFGVPTCPGLDEALVAGADVVYVCTPSSLHLQQALAAAKAGCHLFIEKPVADTVDGLEALYEEVDRRQLATLVGCNFRFHPGLQRVKALLEQGAVGTVVSARAQFGQYLPDWHPWEDYRQGYSANRVKGGGVVLDRIHELDYIHWLLGDVRAVFAWVDHLSHLEIDTEDVAEILLRFAGGAMASVHVDYVRRSYDCRLEIVGDGGTIEWRFAPHEVRWSDAGRRTQHEEGWPWYNPNDMYLEQTKHWLRVLEGKEASAQDCRSALVPLKLALAAKEASASGRAVRI